jgi:hypothetical protein
MDDAPRILALSAIEAPFRSPLVRTQLLDPLCRALHRGARWRIGCLALVPWTFHFTLRRPWRTYRRWRTHWRSLRRHCRSHGMPVRELLLAFPLLPRQFNLATRERKLFQRCAWPVLAGFLLLLRSRRSLPDLIIARSYPAALLARQAKRIFGVQ